MDAQPRVGDSRFVHHATRQVDADGAATGRVEVVRDRVEYVEDAGAGRAGWVTVGDDTAVVADLSGRDAALLAEGLTTALPPRAAAGTDSEATTRG